MELVGKVAVVTGSTRGIGKAISLLLLKEECQVVLNSRSEEEGRELEKTLRKEGFPATYICADVSNSSGVQTLLAGTIKHFSAIDILVNNAGSILHKAWSSYEEKEWNRLLDSNLKSAWLCAKFFVPAMREGGAIINMISSSTHRLELDALPYSVAKTGLIALTRGLAAILAPRIRVNAISPGFVETGFDPYDLANQAHLRQSIALGRFAKPEEVAQATLFLLKNDFITGVVLPVDGGEGLL